ncbi:MAG: hypothetical protein A3F18_02275 [Legionellales bacterium RIFCSPHIGHO2_12_FULL_37_14]|nr:MAG: hypothetical protein A3F18_02275 [Legionellales bacterium RIFCSPHIGHO2_12_FULL_37_14]
MSKFNPFNIDKSYVSPYDQFLAEFDLENELSESQLAEAEKYKLIAKQRDNVQAGTFHKRQVNEN